MLPRIPCALFLGLRVKGPAYSRRPPPTPYSSSHQIPSQPLAYYYTTPDLIACSIIEMVLLFSLNLA